jgi:hypothetical protein
MKTGLQPRPSGEIAQAEARSLRAAGVPPKEIAAKLGFSVDKVCRITRGAAKPPTFKRLTLPDDPVLAQRILNLARRGFDVPPSKQADWGTLQRAGLSVSECKRMLGLE